MPGADGSLAVCRHRLELGFSELLPTDVRCQGSGVAGALGRQLLLEGSESAPLTYRCVLVGLCHIPSLP